MDQSLVDKPWKLLLLRMDLPGDTGDVTSCKTWVSTFLAHFYDFPMSESLCSWCFLLDCPRWTQNALWSDGVMMLFAEMEFPNVNSEHCRVAPLSSSQQFPKKDAKVTTTDLCVGQMDWQNQICCAQGTWFTVLECLSHFASRNFNPAWNRRLKRTKQKNDAAPGWQITNSEEPEFMWIHSYQLVHEQSPEHHLYHMSLHNTLQLTMQYDIIRSSPFQPQAWNLATHHGSPESVKASQMLLWSDSPNKPAWNEKQIMTIDGLWFVILDGQGDMFRFKILVFDSIWFGFWKFPDFLPGASWGPQHVLLWENLHLLEVSWKLGHSKGSLLTTITVTPDAPSILGAKRSWKSCTPGGNHLNKVRAKTTCVSKIVRVIENHHHQCHQLSIPQSPVLPLPGFVGPAAFLFGELSGLVFSWMTPHRG